MRDYIYQFYNEGFGTTFYLKPIKFMNDKIQNKTVINVISMLIKVLYTIIMIIVALLTFIYKWPL